MNSIPINYDDLPHANWPKRGELEKLYLSLCDLEKQFKASAERAEAFRYADLPLVFSQYAADLRGAINRIEHLSSLYTDEGILNMPCEFGGTRIACNPMEMRELCESVVNDLAIPGVIIQQNQGNCIKPESPERQKEISETCFSIHCISGNRAAARSAITDEYQRRAFPGDSPSLEKVDK